MASLAVQPVSTPSVTTPNGYDPVAESARNTFTQQAGLIQQALAQGQNPYGGQQNAINSLYSTYGNNSGLSYQEAAGILGQAYAPAKTTNTTNNTGQTNPLSLYQTQAKAQLPQQLSDLSTEANQYVGNQAGQLGLGVQSLIDSLQNGQQAIDRQGANAALAKQQGTKDILSMVGHGIQGGGVMLANKNAGSSSAAEALARAYGTLGHQQLSGVGNQYAQAANSVGIAQNQFNQQKDLQVSAQQQKKTDIINTVASNAQSAIDKINENMASLSLPDRVDAQAQINQIKQTALAQLSQYDTQLQQGISGINPQSQDQWQTSAAQMAQQGLAPSDAFQYSTLPGAQLQGSGPFASSLPIFTLPNKKQTA